MVTESYQKKILINTIPLLSPLTGVGKYIYQICKALKNIDYQNEYTYYYGYYSKKLLYPQSEDKTIFRTKEFFKTIPGLRRIARGIKNLPYLINNRIFDIYFEPNFIPMRIRARYVIVAIHDFSFKLFPGWHPKDRVSYFEKKFFKEITRADVIITFSDFIKKSTSEFLKIPDYRIKRIYHGFDRNIFRIYEKAEAEEVRGRYKLPENFILFVGSIEPRKNLKNLINAYLMLSEYIRKEYKLLIVGFKGWRNADIMQLIKNTEPYVQYFGYIPDEDLGKIYNLASILVFPSFYEGFGLPPLEAMACGCPVVVSNVASLPEVCGDAAYYINPYGIESIAEGMYKVLTDSKLREDLIQKGLERAKLFSWEKSAREHLKIFETLLGAGSNL